MTKFYRKNELGFSLLCIAAYVVILSVADGVSADMGTEKVLTAPLCLIISFALFFWLRKNGLTEKYGLNKVSVNQSVYLYFIPLIAISTVNFWGGVSVRLSLIETVLYIISMLCVGFIEEIVFRGFLFKALCRDNVKQAVIISSLSFGIGHIVNLLNGAELFSTLLQICYAVAIGFLFTVIFLRSNSLWPCIICHSFTNASSAFAPEGTILFESLTALVLIILSLAYALHILRSSQKNSAQPAKK